MNIEKSLDIIKGKLLMIKKLLKNDEENGHSSSYEMQKEDFEAIETLLASYERELVKSSELEELLENSVSIDEIKGKIEELNDGIKRDMINHDKVKDEGWKLAIHRSMAQKIEIKKVLESFLKGKE